MRGPLKAALQRLFASDDEFDRVIEVLRQNRDDALPILTALLERSRSRVASQSRNRARENA